MSRRKQSRPVKRPIEEEEQIDEKTGPGTKNIRLDQPSTSKASPVVVNSPPAVQSTNALALLEKSLKKFEPSNRTNIPTGKSPTSGSLGALFNCIGKINSPTVSSESDGVASILKCLQCGAGFSIMEHLVKHMQETKHFSNLPKPYSTGTIVDREKPLNNRTKIQPDACLKCGEIPKDMEKHLRDVHLAGKSSDWLKNVQIYWAKTLPAAVLQSPHIKQIMSIISNVERHK